MKHHYKYVLLALFPLLFVTDLKALQNNSYEENDINLIAYETGDSIDLYLDEINDLYQSSPSEALYLINNLESQLRNSDDKKALAYTLKRKAAFYWLQGIYDAALKAYFEALSLFEAQNNKTEVIKMLNNIGETYKKQKDYSQSAKFISEALDKVQENDSLSPELILVNLGQLFMLKENYDSANYYLNRVLNKPDVKSRTLGFIHLYKGIINRELNSIDSSIYHLNKSRTYWADSDYKRGMIESEIELANAYIITGKSQLANQYLETAEREALTINTLDLLLRIYQTKIDLKEIIGTKDSLVYYFDKYLKIKDSIYNAESRAEINELSIQYNLAEKENESYRLALEQAELANEIEFRTQMIIFISLILIVSIILIIYLRNNRNQLREAHILLKKQKEEIEDKQKKLSSKSLALAKVNSELNKLNSTLESRVIERTKKLNERNRQIAEFTYYNSHKLRAPVANVLGLINVMELSKDGKIDPTVLKHLKTCAKELDKVIFNLKNLLDLDEEIDGQSNQ